MNGKLIEKGERQRNLGNWKMMIKNTGQKLENMHIVGVYLCGTGRIFIQIGSIKIKWKTEVQKKIRVFINISVNITPHSTITTSSHVLYPCSVFENKNFDVES